jgi:hypothetical protein
MEHHILSGCIELYNYGNENATANPNKLTEYTVLKNLPQLIGNANNALDLPARQYFWALYKACAGSKNHNNLMNLPLGAKSQKK